MNPKQRAAEAALRFVSSGTVVGLGTGSTADFFLRALAAALRSGALRDIRGLPTSRQSEQLAHHRAVEPSDLTATAEAGRARAGQAGSAITVETGGAPPRQTPAR